MKEGTKGQQEEKGKDEAQIGCVKRGLQKDGLSKSQPQHVKLSVLETQLAFLVKKN